MTKPVTISETTARTVMAIVRSRQHEMEGLAETTRIESARSSFAAEARKMEGLADTIYAAIHASERDQHAAATDWTATNTPPAPRSAA